MYVNSGKECIGALNPKWALIKALIRRDKVSFWEINVWMALGGFALKNELRVQHNKIN